MTAFQLTPFQPSKRRRAILEPVPGFDQAPGSAEKSHMVGYGRAVIHDRNRASLVNTLAIVENFIFPHPGVYWNCAIFGVALIT